MALYSKGDKVIRISTNDKGIIVGIGPCGRGGRQLYKVNYNGVETDELEGYDPNEDDKQLPPEVEKEVIKEVIKD